MTKKERMYIALNGMADAFDKLKDQTKEDKEFWKHWKALYNIINEEEEVKE